MADNRKIGMNLKIQLLKSVKRLRNSEVASTDLNYFYV